MKKSKKNISVNLKTPGVYIKEDEIFGNSVVPAPTSIPAFVGYTPQASFNGENFINVAKKIRSFGEFCSIYCLPQPSDSKDLVKQYNPKYYVVATEERPENEESFLINAKYYTILPDPNSIYYLYNSVRLFYSNGGGDAYIVSVGTYGANSGKPISPGDQIVNPNVKLNDLLKGLVMLQEEQEPTMYICPEATLLSEANNATLMQEMLLQCSHVKRAIGILDIIGARNPTKNDYLDCIKKFRGSTGTNGLDYGTAYFPFVVTTMMQASDFDYTNFYGGDFDKLEALMIAISNSEKEAQELVSSIKDGSYSVTECNNRMIAESKSYRYFHSKALSIANTLPASGGMAGVMTNVDNTKGVWCAPANTSIAGVVDVTLALTNKEQEELYYDAIMGKSVNAIRKISAQGILIWGAKTLDGNNMDWRYLNVRRTVTYIEQSCKLALQSYVFASNTASTWEAVKSSIESFLHSLWNQGGLQGATPNDSYRVLCGLGTTMTEEDINNGFMNVMVSVAVTRPAEFIVISLQQKLTDPD